MPQQHYPSVEQTVAANARVDAALAKLDAPLVTIDAQRAVASTPAAVTPDVAAAQDATLQTYESLKRTNPFVATGYLSRHQHAIYAAMARAQTPGSIRAIQPRIPRI